MKIYFLGPIGTFTHDAARLYFREASEDEFEACGSPVDVIRKLLLYNDDFGVVPIENSVHGEVVPTLDALCFEFEGAFVVGEVSLPISFNWFGLRSSSRPISVASHPHALAQCKRFITVQGLLEQSAASTAEACRIVAERNDETLSAIASPEAGALFGLHTLQPGIEDFAGAYTRFLVLGNCLRASQSANRSMLALVPPNNAIGVLAQFSSVFAKAGVNIFTIHTRPMRTGSGNYLFILTVEGSLARGSTAAAIDSLLSVGYRVKPLGIYCAWGSALPAAPWPNLPGLQDAESFRVLIRKLAC